MLNNAELKVLKDSMLSHPARTLYVFILKPAIRQGQHTIYLTQLSASLSSSSQYFPFEATPIKVAQALEELEQLKLIKRVGFAQDKPSQAYLQSTTNTNYSHLSLEQIQQAYELAQVQVQAKAHAQVQTHALAQYAQYAQDAQDTQNPKLETTSSYVQYPYGHSSNSEHLLAQNNSYKTMQDTSYVNIDVREPNAKQYCLNGAKPHNLALNEETEFLPANRQKGWTEIFDDAVVQQKTGITKHDANLNNAFSCSEHLSISDFAQIATEQVSKLVAHQKMSEEEKQKLIKLYAEQKLAYEKWDFVNITLPLFTAEILEVPSQAFRLYASWLPSATFNQAASFAGLKDHSYTELELNDFINYWLSKTTKKTQHAWERAFAKNLLLRRDVNSRPVYTPKQPQAMLSGVRQNQGPRIYSYHIDNLEQYEVDTSYGIHAQSQKYNPQAMRVATIQGTATGSGYAEKRSFNPNLAPMRLKAEPLPERKASTTYDKAQTMPYQNHATFSNNNANTILLTQEQAQSNNFTPAPSSFYESSNFQNNVLDNLDQKSSSLEQNTAYTKVPYKHHR